MKMSWFSGKAKQSKSNRKQRTRKLCAEQLEARELMATRIWDGDAVANDKWTDNKNWDSNTAPVAGDSLVFPPGVNTLDLTPNNDFPNGTLFNKITFTGNEYRLKGNRITLGNGGIASSAAGSQTNVVEMNLTLAPGFADMGIANFDSMTISGSINGAGGIVMTGGGTLLLGLSDSNANSYSGKTIVNAGTLMLNKVAVNAVSGDLDINGGSVEYASNSNECISDFSKVTISSAISSGSLKLLQHNEKIGGLKILGGSGVIGNSSGTLTVNGVIEVGASVNTTMNGNLSFGGGANIAVGNNSTFTINGNVSNGGLFKLGPGTLELTGNNSFGETQLREGVIVVVSTVAGRTVIPATVRVGESTGNFTAGLLLSGTNEVIANTANIIVGSRGLFSLTNGAQETVNQLSASGSGVRTRLSSVSNTTATQLRLNSTLTMATSGTLESQGNSIIIVNGFTTIRDSSLLAQAGAVDLRGGLVLRGGVVTGAFLILSGNIQTEVSNNPSSINGNLLLRPGNHNFTVDGSPTQTALIITSSLREFTPPTNQATAVSITKLGTGIVEFAGPFLFPTTSFLPNINVTAGTFLVTGFLLNTTQTLSGTGVLGGTSVAGNNPSASLTTGLIKGSSGVVNPGPVNGTGKLNVEGLSTGTGLTFQFDLNLTQFDQIVQGLFASTLFVNQSTLDVRLGFTPALGTAFKIIDNINNPGQGFSGQFKDTAGNVLNEGANFLANNQNFTISYFAGDGNDVVITRNTAPAFENRAITPVITEGNIATLSGHITEPDANDKFFLDVNWGDGKFQTFTFLPNTPRDISVQHKYIDDPVGPNDLFNVKFSWRDQHGGSNKAELPITVNNAAPLVYNLATKIIDAGQRIVEFSAGFLDTDRRNGMTLLVQWTSGGPFQRFELPAGSNTFAVQYKYPTNGLHQISFLLIDDDLGVSSDSLSVRV